MYTKLSVLGAAALLAVGTAHAGQGNPLDPSYHIGQPAQVVAQDSPGERYVDRTNPLSPSYSRNGQVQFQGTAAQSGTPYRDLSNPLNPQYRAK